MAERNPVSKLINIDVNDGGRDSADVPSDSADVRSDSVDVGRHGEDVKIDEGGKTLDVHVDTAKRGDTKISVTEDSGRGPGKGSGPGPGSGKDSGKDGHHQGQGQRVPRQRAPQAPRHPAPQAPRQTGGGGGGGGGGNTGGGGGGGSNPGGGQKWGGQPRSGGNHPDPSSGKQVTIRAGYVRELGKKVGTIERTLQQAQSRMQGAKLGSGAFSADGTALGYAYPGAQDFCENDIKSKIEQLQKMSDGLVQTAATWEQAEQKSTVKRSG